MNNYIKRIKNEFSNNSDLIIKELRINLLHKIYVIFLDTLSSQDKINDYILKKIVSVNLVFNIQNILPSGNVIKLKQYDEIEYHLYNGFTIIIDNKDIYAIETKADIYRGVSTNETEPSIKGPKNAFVENYQINIGLIKKRIKNHHLKIKNVSIGRLSNTNIGILYIDNIAKNELIENVYQKLTNIDIDLINDSADLYPFLTKKSIFPTLILTERPDRCADALASGKVVIICDESPNAIILPAFLVDFIHPYSDRYNKSVNINLTKIIRLICFFLSIMVPAFYISIINYNQEAIPTSLIINFATQRTDIPFPAVIECFMMLIICEILRESDLRFPTKYGSSVSVLGALLIGEAAVSAGLVTPIMIIITAFTYISALIFTDIEIGNAIRSYRFIFLITSAVFGLYGFMIAFIFFIINLCDTDSFNHSYTFPISPFDKSYFKDVFFKLKNGFRSKYLSKNIIKEKP